jgi:hypothetical protein
MPSLSKKHRRNRNKVKHAIIHENMELFDEVFAVEKYKVTHISENGAKIVKLWREKIGYSKNTWDGDLLWNAYRNWNQIKGNQKR